MPFYAAALLPWLYIKWSAGVLTRVRLVALTILLRLPFLFIDPTLSNDVYRYLWDGRVLASGANPYAYAPDDERFATLRQQWHARINHPGIRTVYPPHAELLFGAIPSLLAWRTLLIAADVAVVLMLPPGSRLLYAACPVVIVEGVWSGHIDLLAGFLLLLAIQRRSGIAAALAIGMKLTPLAALPAMGLRRRGWMAFLAALVIPALFFMGGDFMPGLRDYATRWIFNSPAFDALFFAIDGLHVASALKVGWGVVKDALHLEAISDVVFRHLYSDFVTRVVLAIAAFAAIAWRRRSATECVAALLLLSPAIHPWYWLAIAPLAIAERHPLVWLIAAAPFSYLLYEGAPKTIVYALCYAIPGLCVAATSLPRPSAFATSGAGSPLVAMRPRTGRDTSPT